jgi:hypothetical protein
VNNFDGSPTWSSSTTNDLNQWSGANSFVNGGGAGAAISTDGNENNHRSHLFFYTNRHPIDREFFYPRSAFYRPRQSSMHSVIVEHAFFQIRGTNLVTLWQLAIKINT